MVLRICGVINISLRVAALAAFLVGPIGAFAFTQTGDKQSGLSGASFMLYTSHQHNAY